MGPGRSANRIRGITMKVFALGQSHLLALSNSVKRSPPANVDIDFLLCNEPQFRPVVQDGALNSAILERLQGAGADLHVSVLGGNDHCIVSMVNHPRRFDVVLPEAPDLFTDETAEVLPADLVTADLSRRIAPHVEALAAYRSHVPGRLVHVESPPPVPSEAHIRKHPGVFREMIDERGVSPALLRYKIWRLHSRLYAKACAELDVEFLPVPSEMQDDRGMMVERAWNPDPTHGNALYGSAVIAKLLHEAA